MKRQNKTILVAEDDPNDQLLLKRAFNKVNVTENLQIVASGFEAIAYLDGVGKYSDRKQFEFPSFIITDLKMPMGTGFDILRHVEQNRLWQVIPIVVLSASTDTDDIKKAYLAGAKAYLVKPSNSTALHELIRKFCDFWMEVEVPQFLPGGEMKSTVSEGKMGEEL